MECLTRSSGREEPNNEERTSPLLLNGQKTSQSSPLTDMLWFRRPLGSDSLPLLPCHRLQYRKCYPRMGQVGNFHETFYWADMSPTIVREPMVQTSLSRPSLELQTTHGWVSTAC